MAWEILDTHTLMELQTQTQAPSNFWLSRYFGNVMTFDTQYIDFEHVVNGRKLAPFVSPLARGKVMKDRGSSMKRFTPAYVKPKHSLDPNKVLKRRPGEAIGGSSSPSQRANAILMEYMQNHREIIERRWEWLAAKAMLDGKVVIESDDYPATEVDFGRAAGHTVTLTGDYKWNGISADIKGDITGWVTTMRNAQFGGPVADLIMTPTAFDVMIKDDAVRDLLNTNYRGSSDSLNRSVLDGSAVQQVGVLGGFLNVLVYQDWFEDDAGNAENFMTDGDILLVGNNVNGVRAFGAIMDSDNDYMATDIFQKMFKENDPSATFLLSQSAPLMIPVNPNCTLKATVL